MQPPTDLELTSRFTPLSTGTPGLRSTLTVRVTKPSATHETHSLSATGGPHNSKSSSLDGQLTGGGLGKSLGKGEVGRSDSTVQRSNDSTDAVLDFVSSDETLDRYNEIILASGWQI